LGLSLAIMITLNYSETTHFTGRNGTFKQTGVTVTQYAHNGVVCLAPITSKGREGNCLLSIPHADLPALIVELTKLSRS
jgi:hypothetical protein